MPPANHKLIISLINHSNPELLKDCLASIPAAADDINYEVYVVDNFSGGRLVSELQGLFPDVRWIFNSRRRGFGYNHNLVMSQASGQFYCILNDDTVLHPGSLKRLVDMIGSDVSIGMVGPRLLNADGTIQDSVFREWNLAIEAINAFTLPRFLNRWKRLKLHPSQGGNSPASVAWLLGACIVVSKAAIDRVGMFDVESFPVANNEELDWCRRMRSAGLKIYFDPSAVVTHFGGQTLTRECLGNIPWMALEMHRTKLLYFRKHNGWSGELMARAILVAASLWNTLAVILGWLRGRMSKVALFGSIITYRNILRVALSSARTPVGPYASFANQLD